MTRNPLCSCGLCRTTSRVTAKKLAFQTLNNPPTPLDYNKVCHPAAELKALLYTRDKQQVYLASVSQEATSLRIANSKQAFSPVIKMPTLHSEILGFNFGLWLLTPASCWCRPWETVEIASVIGFLPPMEVTWIEFPASSFSPSPTSATMGIWGLN